MVQLPSLWRSMKKVTDSYERKVEICSRAYKLLVEEIDFPPEDIIFDPNIFAIATGIEEHNSYAKSYIDAAKELKTRFPKVHISGGVSNLSFSFRGNDILRRLCTHPFCSTLSKLEWIWVL